MLWRVAIYFIFLFYYTSNGQILLAPVKEQIANVTSKLKQKLNLETKGINGSIKALKAKRPYEYIHSPSQWAQEPEEASFHWPGGQVRYYIDGDSYGKDVVMFLMMAFDVIRGAGEYNCPIFQLVHQKPSDNDDEGDWLHFTNPDRVRPCVHEPGVNRGGETKIVLGYDCLKPRDVLHTVLHGLGFRDEIMHPKRDLVVRVMWENIQPAFRTMFRLQPVEAIDGLTEYDPMSIMHFHDRAYSVNGQPTIMPVLPGLKIDPSEKLSRLDTTKIRRIFGHECKKLHIDKILNSCGRINNIPVNENHCGNGGHDEDDKIVIPGNDVQPQGGNEVSNEGEHDGNEAGIVKPGSDVKPQGENEDGNERGVVIPGNDVQPEGENKGSNEDGIVIPGDDVKLKRKEPDIVIGHLHFEDARIGQGRVIVDGKGIKTKDGSIVVKHVHYGGGSNGKKRKKGNRDKKPSKKGKSDFGRDFNKKK